MAVNRGKLFEEQFKKDFLKIPDCSFDRLYDTTNGFRGITNICDGIGYVKPYIYYIELKTIKGNTFPITNFTQYKKMVDKVGIPGVRSGVVIWFYDHDRIIYVPTKTFTQLINDNKKSVNIRKSEEEGYRIINVPSVKKRIMLCGDYTVLLNLEDGD